MGPFYALAHEHTGGRSALLEWDEEIPAFPVVHRELLKARGYRADELGEHAGLPDTSLTLALDPRLVRSNPPRDDEQLPGVGTGVEGDPSRASADLGRLGVDLIVDRTVAAIRESTTRR